MYNGRGEWRPAVSFCYTREIDKSNGIFSRLPVITEASKREDDIRLIMSSQGLWDENSMIGCCGLVESSSVGVALHPSAAEISS